MSKMSKTGKICSKVSILSYHSRAQYVNIERIFLEEKVQSFYEEHIYTIQFKKLPSSY